MCHDVICDQRNHISHSLFWVNAEGKAPPPFTPISHKDVVMKKWVAALPENQVRPCCLWRIVQ